MDYSAKCDHPEDQAKIVDFILTQIAKAGDRVQSALIEQQEALYGDHFKRVRRHLPITRTKMDW